MNKLATSIEGSVVSINDEGNLVTDIDEQQLHDAPRDTSVTVAFGPHETNGIFSADHTEPDSTLIAVLSEGGKLEIGIVGMSLHEMLQVDVGEKIKVSW